MLADRWQTLAGETQEGNRQADGLAALLTSLSTLRFQGADAYQFLQGYLTCDVERLADGEPHLAALTNLQGRVVANGWCHSRDRETEIARRFDMVPGEHPQPARVDR